jgi:GT2 family glycosyltransferase
MEYKNFDFIRIIFSDKNIGFAEGNNLASKYTKGKYIVLLNADTISDYNVFKEIVDCVENNEKVGIVGPKCIDENGVIQESYGDEPSILKEIRGKIFMPLYLEKFGLIKKIKNKILQKDELAEVGWIGGACVVIIKDLWERLGGLDSAYFFSNGDMIDFCYRAKKLGYLSVYYPKVSIIHKGSRSVTRDLKTRIMGLKKGYLGTLYFFSKNKKGIIYIYLTKIVFIILSFMKGISALFLSIFDIKFKDLSFSHLIVSSFLIKNFFNNDFIRLCQE